MAERRDRPASLPRGRHGLSRDEVAATQRARMMLAMAEAMAEQGFVSTSVSDVLRRAGVSRETFYQQFSSKLDCFLHTFDAAGAVLVARMEGGLSPEGTRQERFDRAFTAYLDALVAEPAHARLFLVEVHAAGPAAIERRAALQARMADALADLLDVTSDHGRFACQALVAAVATLVTAPLVAGDTTAVRALREPVLDLVHRALAADRA